MSSGTFHYSCPPSSSSQFPFFLPQSPSSALLLSQRATDLLEGITKKARRYCTYIPTDPKDGGEGEAVRGWILGRGLGQKPEEGNKKQHNSNTRERCSFFRMHILSSAPATTDSFNVASLKLCFKPHALFHALRISVYAWMCFSTQHLFPLSVFKPVSSGFRLLLFIK